MSKYFDKLANTWDQDPMKIERSQLTAEYCKKVSLKSKERLLDFGGGTGLLSLFLNKSFKHITIADSSEEMLKVAQNKIEEAKITNIETIKIESDISEITKKYSAIITLMTLHHILKIDDFFKNASKILNDDGALMIADLFKEDGSFHKHTQNFEGHNGFKIECLSNKLNSAGFNVSQVEKYYEIKKKISPSKKQTFPLFFIVAKKC